MSDHTSKRQRTTGSFSPASPPYHQVAKANDPTKAPIVHPNTPTSPPYMSTNSQSNGGFAGTAIAPSSEMTPPGSVTLSQHASQPATSASNPLPFPTPASTAGGPSSVNIDSDGDAMMAETSQNDLEHTDRHRHSNHNRQGTGSAAGSENGTGALFKLCQKAHERSRPHVSQNLFELYGLNDLARSVARNDPVTGEKINKLRKSYEGHIKALQIAGKPKAVKMQGVLSQPLQFPDEEWNIQKVSGHEMEKALNNDKTGLSSDFGVLLDHAFAGMAPGPLPTAEAQRYRAYLGTDEAAKPKGAMDGALNRPMTPLVQAATPSQASRASRPERTGAKRSYTEASFAGYSEGYQDDYIADSTGGEDNGQGSLSKKRKLGFERTSHQVEVGGARR